MRRRLLDLLACPECKHFPLSLSVEQEREVEGLGEVPERPLCEEWCSYTSSKPSDPNLCVECMRKDVLAGELRCESCGATYRIEAGVPRMLPPAGG